ncbi:MAG: gliding motility-associated ABC transporter ATP-binding subunit GldA [Bacteroidota bacterium]
MSIEVIGVTKIYGQQKALDDVSFTINRGEIVGFLGPNGAGKSTMMKIICCYLPQSKGTVKVNGLDVKEESIAVRKKIGYLPEHNPLYLEMYVKEYLEFVLGLYGKSENKKQKVSDIIELVGLKIEQNKKISALSKGYRQRVGLAQALIHQPEVLILDEPTTGLDPNQLVEIRNVIKSAGKEKTVLFSTHIMQEVEAVCDRIIIISKGKIVADENKAGIKNLQSTKKQIITVEFDKAVSESLLLKITGVNSAVLLKDNLWKLSSNLMDDLRPKIAKFAQENNLLILTMVKVEETLEDVFRNLTS